MEHHYTCVHYYQCNSYATVITLFAGDEQCVELSMENQSSPGKPWFFYEGVAEWWILLCLDINGQFMGLLNYNI